MEKKTDTKERLEEMLLDYVEKITHEPHPSDKAVEALPGVAHVLIELWRL